MYISTSLCPYPSLSLSFCRYIINMFHYENMFYIYISFAISRSNYHSLSVSLSLYLYVSKLKLNFNIQFNINIQASQKADKNDPPHIFAVNLLSYKVSQFN